MHRFLARIPERKVRQERFGRELQQWRMQERWMRNPNGKDSGIGIQKKEAVQRLRVNTRWIERTTRK